MSKPIIECCDEWLNEINGMDEDGRLSHEGKR